MSKTITVNLVLAQIVRGHDKVATEVPEHEVPMLQAVHGRTAVRVIEREGTFTQEMNADSTHELARIEKKYRRKNSPNMIGQAYPAREKSLEEYGFNKGSGKSTEPARSRQRDRRAEAGAKAEAESDKADKDAAAKAKAGGK